MTIPVLLPHLPCNRFPIHHFCFPRGGGLAFPPSVRSRAVSSAESGHASHCGEGTQPHQVILIADKYTRHDSDGQNLGLKGPDHFTWQCVTWIFSPHGQLEGAFHQRFCQVMIWMEENLHRRISIHIHAVATGRLKKFHSISRCPILAAW